MTMASAYSAFANEGVKYDAHFIRRIVDASGKTIVDEEDADSTRVVSEKIANEMTSMMIDVYKNGTGASAKPYGYTIAGKTGSTQGNGVDPTAADTDRWYIGYTPDVVLATWVGFDSNKNSIENAGTRGGAALFKSEMEGILPKTKQSQFKVKAASTLAYENISSSSNLWDSIKNAGANIEKSGSGIKQRSTHGLMPASRNYNRFSEINGGISMINIYDTANQMEQDLRKTSQYQELQTAYEALKADETAFKCFNEIHSLQEELQKSKCLDKSRLKTTLRNFRI